MSNITGTLERRALSIQETAQAVGVSRATVSGGLNESGSQR